MGLEEAARHWATVGLGLGNQSGVWCMQPGGEPSGTGQSEQGLVHTAGVELYTTDALVNIPANTPASAPRRCLEHDAIERMSEPDGVPTGDVLSRRRYTVSAESTL